jgi:hypothetical protein
MTDRSWTRLNARGRSDYVRTGSFSSARGLGEAFALTVEGCTMSYSPRHLAAFERWKRDGFSLTGLADSDLASLTNEDPNFADSVRAERNRRLAANAEPKSDPHPPVAAPTVQSPVTDSIPARVYHLKKGESIESYLSDHPFGATPLVMYKALERFCDEMNAKNVGRNERIDAIEKRLDCPVP